MKKDLRRILPLALLLTAGYVFLLFYRGDIGVSRSRVERDARSGHHIAEDWHVAADSTDRLYAMVFYPENRSDHTFSIYIDRDGLSFGYFFRGGGSIAGPDDGVVEYIVGDCPDRAFISMNRARVCRIEVDDGVAPYTIGVDSAAPFAVILPVNCGIVTLYDVEGATVEPIPHHI